MLYNYEYYKFSLVYKVDNLLCFIQDIILFYFRRCGHTPVAAEDASYMARLRDNSKQLFSIIIDDHAIQTLLENQTIEEVIVHVLKLAKA